MTETLEIRNQSDGPDELVPDRQVWHEFGICAMTGWRWSRDPELKFPPPIKIRARNFRSRRMLENFKQRMLHLALAERARAYSFGTGGKNNAEN